VETSCCEPSATAPIRRVRPFGWIGQQKVERLAILAAAEPTRLTLRGQRRPAVRGRTRLPVTSPRQPLVTAEAEYRDTRRLYDTITAPQVLGEFASDEGASGHFEGAAPALHDQRTYDWLDRVPAR
jgi:hypothetical protein